MDPSVACNMSGCVVESGGHGHTESLAPEDIVAPACGAGELIDAASKETHMPIDWGDCLPLSCLEGMVGATCLASENGSYWGSSLAKSRHVGLPPCVECL